MSSYGPFWQRPGAMFRVPGAGSVGPKEALEAMHAGHYGYAAFDPKTGEWKAEREICARLGLDVVAWTRVLSYGMLQDLRDAQKRWNAAAIMPDIEIGDGGSGSTRDALLMHSTLVAMAQVGKALLVTDGWADPIGQWLGFRRWVGGVCCFPEELPALRDVDGCVLHASAFFRAVVPILGAYGTTFAGGRKPRLADYAERPPLDPWIVYSADDVEDWRWWGCP